MSIAEKLKAIQNLEKVLHDYSAWFVDWESMYNNPSYKPEFPLNLIQATKDLRLIAAELGTKT